MTPWQSGLIGLYLVCLVGYFIVSAIARARRTRRAQRYAGVDAIIERHRQLANRNYRGWWSGRWS